MNIIKSTFISIYNLVSEIIKPTIILLIGNFLWYCIISFIDGNWNILEWYLYTRGWGRFVLVLIELAMFMKIIDED